MEHYTKGHIIGRGTTATVSLATTVTGEIFAVKSTELSTSSFLQKEQYLLSKLISPYVIKYIGYDISYVDNNNNNNIPMYNMIMEYAPGGTISDVINQQGGLLNESLIRSYTHQTLLGLDYLHSNNIVHCDIKCSNILVCEERVKIGDLGCAKLVDISTTQVTSSATSGTPAFMAPEVARGEQQGFAADVWALGCAVIEMATGCHPWQGLDNPVSALYRIGYSGDVPLFPDWLTEEAKDFLKKCLERNCEERWNVKELLQHPFVNSGFRAEKIESFPKRSPSSVLDQGFWDTFEVTESSARTGFMGFSGESPMNRIKQLVEAIPVNCCLPNWGVEEDWIIVRGDRVEQNLNIIIHEDMEDEISESTRSDSESISEFYVEEGFNVLVRSVIESNLLETSDASVVNSRFLDFKNINNSICLLVDSNLTLPFVHNSVKRVWLKFMVEPSCLVVHPDLLNLLVLTI